MTWAEIKTAIEAQGVEDSTVIGSIHIEKNKPVNVVINTDDPDNPDTVDVKSEY